MCSLAEVEDLPVPSSSITLVPGQRTSSYKTFQFTTEAFPPGTSNQWLQFVNPPTWVLQLIEKNREEYPLGCISLLNQVLLGSQHQGSVNISAQALSIYGETRGVASSLLRIPTTYNCLGYSITTPHINAPTGLLGLTTFFPSDIAKLLEDFIHWHWPIRVHLCVIRASSRPRRAQELPWLYHQTLASTETNIQIPHSITSVYQIALLSKGPNINPFKNIQVFINGEVLQPDHPWGPLDRIMANLDESSEHPNLWTMTFEKPPSLFNSPNWRFRGRLIAFPNELSLKITWGTASAATLFIIGTAHNAGYNLPEIL